MIKYIPSFAWLLLLLSVGCTKDTPVPVEPEPEPEPEEETFDFPNLAGHSQKGPYINGSTVGIQELNEAFAMTGRSFSGTITDNSGAFRFDALTLENPVVDMTTTGFYYNEVTNTNSEAQLTLMARVDLTDVAGANLNILGHLARNRIVYLMEDENKTFPVARTQAQAEVYAMLSFTPPAGQLAFDQLDISQTGQGNAALLAASIIFQGRRETADLTQLLADISSDLRTDGTLDAPELGSALITDVLGINLDTVRANITRRYESLQVSAVIPAFEPYIEQFIQNTSFVPVALFQYPEEGIHGPNILAGSAIRDTLVVSTEFASMYSLSAIVPDNNRLTLRMTGDRSQGNISYAVGSDRGWQRTSSGGNDDVTTFEVNGDGIATQYKVVFRGAGELTLELFENDVVVPSRTRVIQWGELIDLENDIPVYPDSLQGQPNLLALLHAGSRDLSPGDYVLAVTLPETYDLTIRLNIRPGLWESHQIRRELTGDFSIFAFPPEPMDNPDYAFGKESFVDERGTTISFPIKLLEVSDSMNFIYDIYPRTSPMNPLEDVLEDFNTVFHW